MIKSQKGQVKTGLIVLICVLVVILLAIFGVMGFMLFHEEKKEPQYAKPQNVIVNKDDDDDELMVLDKIAKPIEYCTEYDCKIKEINHFHYGDKVSYNPNKLKEGFTEENLKCTTYPLNTGEGTQSVVFDANEVDKIQDWYVAGMENGQIVLIAGKTTETKLPLKGAKGTTNSAYEMNKVCSIYGHGAGADKAECLSLDELNKLAGINTDLANSKVTYKDNSPVEYLFNFGKLIEYRTNYKEKEKVDPWTIQNEILPTYITQYIISSKPLEVKSGYYGYLLNSDKVLNSDKMKLGLNKDMWLATIGMNADDTSVRYGPAGITSDNIVVSAIDLFDSEGAEKYGNYPLRPIVKLDRNINTGILEKILD